MGTFFSRNKRQESPSSIESDFRTLAEIGHKHNRRPGKRDSSLHSQLQLCLHHLPAIFSQYRSSIDRTTPISYLNTIFSSCHLTLSSQAIPLKILVTNFSPYFLTMITTCWKDDVVELRQNTWRFFKHLIESDSVLVQILVEAGLAHYFTLRMMYETDDLSYRQLMMGIHSTLLFLRWNGSPEYAIWNDTLMQEGLSDVLTAVRTFSDRLVRRYTCWTMIDILAVNTNKLH
ncbi:hypothetical protein BLNAU_2624 [Blattamonas nauphoetae]|uniref:Uncharacterized protein n=1 Tax=Blattamonas nauphoetae TaxID=2049346 RepID=A0ABQ9YF29_9EUKA|nr:hypothetical protein BLNAU_2624 [Blattamonas nauphoetae]